MRKITKSLRGYVFDWYSEKELLEIFPESKEVIPLAIEEWTETYDLHWERIKSFLKYVSANASEQGWFWEILADKLLCHRLREAEKHLIRLKRLHAFNNSSPPTQSVYQESFEEKRDKAKIYPIESLARNFMELRPAGKNFSGLCPFHNERTPSFYLYTETNSFHCFGCQVGGDVITLTMQLYGIGFTDALKMLK